MKNIHSKTKQNKKQYTPIYLANHSLFFGFITIYMVKYKQDDDDDDYKVQKWDKKNCSKKKGKNDVEDKNCNK